MEQEAAGQIASEVLPKNEVLPAVEAAHPNIDGKVWRLALPAIGENVLHTAILMVDTLMIARFDPTNPALLAASAVAGSILWRSHMTFGCIEKGTTALVARYTGEGRPEEVGKVVAQSIYLAIAIGAFLSIGGYLLAERLLALMGSDLEVIIAGTPFLQVIFLASIPRMFLYVASASLRGSGDTRTPMDITLGMNGVNLLFNWLLIYGALGFPRLGLTGSGISTALALIFAAVVMLGIMFTGRTRFHLKWHHFRPDWHISRSILRISWPSLLEEILVSFGFLSFFAAIAYLGTETVAAHTLSTRVEALSFMAGHGFAVAAATLVGQSLGAGNVALARLSFRRTTTYCVLMMSVISIFLILAGEYILMIFGPDTGSVRSLAYTLLIISAVEQPLMAMCMTLGGGIRGAGDTLSPMMVSIVGNIGIRLGFCWLSAIFGWGIIGIYIGTVVDWTFRAALLYTFYVRGRWSRIKL